MGVPDGVFLCWNGMWSLYHLSRTSSLLPYTHIYVNVLKSTYKSYIEQLVRLQKKVLRIITGSKKLSHSAPLNELKILRFEQLYYVSAQMFMYKFYHNTLPDIFSNLYICNSDIHSYNTRQHLCYHVPMSRLTQTSRNIRYTGVKRHAFMSSIISYCCSLPHIRNILRMFYFTIEI